MIKAAIIGVGYISRQHIRAIQATSNAELVAICDLSPAVAESVAEQFGIARWFTDHREMLDTMKPDVTHITTPIRSHVPLACDVLSSGSNAFVEKPITASYEEWLQLRDHARSVGRWVMEDHNYRFNRPMIELAKMIACGQFGKVAHTDITFCLDLAKSVFADRNVPHETLSMRGGAIFDFIPHMAYLADSLIGPHLKVSTLWEKRNAESVLPHDEFRAMVKGESGTASLSFISQSQPDGFWVTVYGSKMQARINLLEDRISTVGLGGGPPPLMHMFNGLREGSQIRKAARKSLFRKLSGGPASYDGLFELIRQIYTAIAEDREMPVTIEQVDRVQNLVRDLTGEVSRL